MTRFVLSKLAVSVIIEQHPDGAGQLNPLITIIEAHRQSGRSLSSLNPRTKTLCNEPVIDGIKVAKEETAKRPIVDESVVTAIHENV